MDLLKILPQLKDINTDYRKSIENQYKTFIDYADIPIGYQKDINYNVSGKLNKVFDNIDLIVKDRYNILLNFADYRNTGYISFQLINTYFKKNFENDDILESIVYVDTNLLVEDFKRLMNNENAQNTVHKVDTLYNGIEKASLVIWDKFSKLESTYDKHKIYDILSIRKRNDLANMFLISGGTSKLSQVIGNDIFDVMDPDICIDCSRINLEIINKKGNAF